MTKSKEQRYSLSYLFCLKRVCQKKKLACSYCAVGCKFEADEKKFKAIKEYPTNQGGSCAKGMSQPKSIFTRNRLLYPQKRESPDTPFCISSYDEVLEYIASKIKNTHQIGLDFIYLDRC